MQLPKNFTVESVEAIERKLYLDLLLLADEQESMIDKYLYNSDMYVMKDGCKAVACCVVSIISPNEAEIKNLAVLPEYQGRGLGRAFISYAEKAYSKACSLLFVGTGDSPATVPFYEKCGFVRHHIVENFFVDNYDHPIIDGGVLLTDMIYLAKEI